MRDRLILALNGISEELKTIPDQSAHIDNLVEKLEKSIQYAQNGEMLKALEVLE